MSRHELPTLFATKTGVCAKIADGTASMNDMPRKDRRLPQSRVSRPATTKRNPWADIVGPSFTSRSLARALGWTELEVIEAAGLLRILELRTADGVALYPQFQLWDGGVVHGLAEVLRALRAGVDDPWTWAQWLNVRLRDSDGADEPSNIEQLRAGHLSNVLRGAEHDAAAWRA